MTRPAILAVDGGGSKTEVALVGARGQLLGAARRSGGWETHGSNGGSDSLDLAVAAACRDAGIDPADGPIARLGVYCLSLVDLAVDERRFTADMAARGLTDERLVRNDTFAVMRAGTERSWGVGVVCGAGINCVGVAPNGRTVRFPALGLISGDWGGGYWVGMGA